MCRIDGWQGAGASLQRGLQVVVHVLTRARGDDLQDFAGPSGIIDHRRPLMRPEEAPARDPRAASGGNADSIARHDEIVLAGEAQRLRELFVAKKLGIDECLQFYNLVLQAHGGFPHDWEYNVLLLGLEREPGRDDLIRRLAIVRDLLAVESSFPVKP